MTEENTSESAQADAQTQPQETPDIDVSQMSSEQISGLMQKMKNGEEIPELQSSSDKESAPQQESSQEEEQATPIEQEINNYKQAMKEERRKRQELEQKFADMQESYNEILAKQESGELDEEEAVDEIEQLRREHQALNEKIQTREQQEQQNQQVQQFLNEYRSSAQKFAESNQDFSDAYQFLQNSKIGEYEALGYSKEEASSMVINDEYALVHKANQDGVNPAKRLYDLAKTRGFSGASKNLDNIKRGVNASRSLGQASSKSDNLGEISMEDMANLSGKDFSDAWSKMVAENKKKTFID